MLLLKSILPIAAFVLTPFHSGVAEDIKGSVTDENGTPVRDAHVYVVHGEEESLTNSKGTFKITTWQKFPVTVTVDHKGYEQSKQVVRSPTSSLQIRLKSKTNNR